MYRSVVKERKLFILKRFSSLCHRIPIWHKNKQIFRNLWMVLSSFVFLSIKSFYFRHSFSFPYLLQFNFVRLNSSFVEICRFPLFIKPFRQETYLCRQSFIPLSFISMKDSTHYITCRWCTSFRITPNLKTI